MNIYKKILTSITIFVLVVVAFLGYLINSYNNNEDIARRLGYAASRRDVTSVRLLFSQGANPNMPYHFTVDDDPVPTTAWQEAVYSCNDEIIKIFIAHGADINANFDNATGCFQHPVKGGKNE